MTYWNGTAWVADRAADPPSGPARRLTNWIATLLMIALIPLLFVTMAGAAAAGKPTSSVWVNEVSAFTAQSALAFGDPFSVGYSTKDREPWAYARCYPNATTVFSGTNADGSVWASVFSVYPEGPSPQAFVLGMSIYPLWTGGGADCVVDLVTYSRDLSRRSVLATTWFSVGP